MPQLPVRGLGAGACLSGQREATEAGCPPIDGSIGAFELIDHESRPAKPADEI